MHKRGDTLIEVALAIGIFSLVAVAVVAVVSGSTSNAQAALELTITREEIDAQAEAIRFIQTSYIAGGSANAQGNTKYKELWKEIADNAINLSNTVTSTDITDAILNYNPSTCESIYQGDNLARQHAFVINTRNLGLSDVNSIIIRPKSGNIGAFKAAATYPRMVYDNEEALLDHSTSSLLTSIEGIYVVAVKDNNKTTVITDGGTVEKRTSAYYDFYIRTCWFNAGASRPSTISTVIRLQDPAIIMY